MIRALVIFSCVIMTGCAAMNKNPPIVEVKVPVTVSCIASVYTKPDFKSDAELKAMDDYTLANTLLFERIGHQIYELELEAIIAGCK